MAAQQSSTPGKVRRPIRNREIRPETISNFKFAESFSGALVSGRGLYAWPVRRLCIGAKGEMARDGARWSEAGYRAGDKAGQQGGRELAREVARK